MSIDQNIPVTTGAPNSGSAVALANAITVAVGVYRGITGTTIANTIDGSPLLTAQLATLSGSLISKELIERYNTARNMGLIKN